MELILLIIVVLFLYWILSAVIHAATFLFAIAAVVGIVIGGLRYLERIRRGPSMPLAWQAPGRKPARRTQARRCREVTQQVILTTKVCSEAARLLPASRERSKPVVRLNRSPSLATWKRTRQNVRSALNGALQEVSRAAVADPSPVYSELLTRLMQQSVTCEACVSADGAGPTAQQGPLCRLEASSHQQGDRVNHEKDFYLDDDGNIVVR